MIRVAISGACGRMGRRLVAVVHEEPDMEVAAALEAPSHPHMGHDAGEAAGTGALGVKVAAELEAEVDVLIEFSAPEPSVAHANLCAERGIAAVIGVTGLEEAQKARIAQAAERTPILLAPNMSVGVNVAFEAAAMLARTLGEGYDVEIVETHHRHKKDAPSGTALGFAERVADALGRDLSRDASYGRHGQTGERPRGEIGIHAVRGGDVVGEHTVLFAGPGERIELTHRASSRDIFVHGAVRMARLLLGKPAGLYGAGDLLFKA